MDASKFRVFSWTVSHVTVAIERNVFLVSSAHLLVLAVFRQTELVVDLFGTSQILVQHPWSD